jgi:hypothetical protein
MMKALFLVFFGQRIESIAISTTINIINVHKLREIVN